MEDRYMGKEDALSGERTRGGERNYIHVYPAKGAPTKYVRTQKAPETTFAIDICPHQKKHN